MRDPKRRAEQRERARAHSNPEVMRERSRAMWRNPEIRAKLTASTKARTNSSQHQARMIAHNEKLWADPAFRQRHKELTSKRAARLWQDPAFRAARSAQTVAANKKRWADPEYKTREKAIRRSEKQSEEKGRRHWKRPYN